MKVQVRISVWERVLELQALSPPAAEQRAFGIGHTSVLWLYIVRLLARSMSIMILKTLGPRLSVWYPIRPMRSLPTCSPQFIPMGNEFSRCPETHLKTGRASPVDKPRLPRVPPIFSNISRRNNLVSVDTVRHSFHWSQKLTCQ